MGDRSICHTFCRQLVNNHGWIAASAFGPYDPLVPRHIRTQILAIGVLWVLCCEAVLATFEVGSALFPFVRVCVVCVASIEDVSLASDPRGPRLSGRA